MIDCVLIVVSYRSAADVAALLTTVPEAVGELTWHAIVVNNDQTEDLGPAVTPHQTAEVIEAGANLGYAGGINRGLASAPQSRWTVFLNPDLRLSPGVIMTMVATAGDHSAVVPVILSEHGVVQWSLRREPSVTGALGEALLGNRWTQRPAVFTEMIRTPTSYRRPGPVDWATGAVLLVPTTAVERVGNWDAGRFFLYSEETDYCRRLRMAGVPVRFQPNAVVMHRGGGSGTSDSLHALQEVNKVRYFRKWHGQLETFGFAAVVVLHNLLRIHRPHSRAALKAMLSRTVRATLPGGSQ